MIWTIRRYQKISTEPHECLSCLSEHVCTRLHRASSRRVLPATGKWRKVNTCGLKIQNRVGHGLNNDLVVETFIESRRTRSAGPAGAPATTSWVLTAIEGTVADGVWVVTSRPASRTGSPRAPMVPWRRVYSPYAPPGSGKSPPKQVPLHLSTYCHCHSVERHDGQGRALLGRHAQVAQDHSVVRLIPSQNL